VSPHNPQGIFAFYGYQLSGQAPPYTGNAPQGNEAWYYLLQNMSTDRRVWCSELHIEDVNGDGLNEIMAQTEDGRFYILNRTGDVIWTDRSDDFLKEFGYVDVPELVWVELGLDEYEPVANP